MPVFQGTRRLGLAATDCASRKSRITRREVTGTHFGLWRVVGFRVFNAKNGATYKSPCRTFFGIRWKMSLYTARYVVTEHQFCRAESLLKAGVICPK
jgi:hypothetical protein